MPRWKLTVISHTSIFYLIKLLLPWEVSAADDATGTTLRVRRDGSSRYQCKELQRRAKCKWKPRKEDNSAEERITAALNYRQESMRSPYKQHLSSRSSPKGPPGHISRNKHHSREIRGFSKGLGFANTRIRPMCYLVNTNWLLFQSQSLVTSCQHLLFSTERPHHRKLARRTGGSCEGCSGLCPSASGTGAALRSRENKSVLSPPPSPGCCAEHQQNSSRNPMFWGVSFDFF